MRRIFVSVAATLVLATAVRAQTPLDTTARLTVGGFVDGYYAWDAGRPATLDRSFAGGAPFTTQPARHNEFNVNLAFLELKLDGAQVRGRVALQAGTSVQSNYAGEPTMGATSGPSLGRHIQEAFGGVKVGKTAWIDGGIFFSHVGMESWASRDNPTYSRSLVAEYSPYYQAGARLTWMPAGRVTAQIDVVNGWQNVSENNTGKGAGARIDWTPTAGAMLSYYNLFSDEAGAHPRLFNGVGAKFVRGAWTFLGQADLGMQSHREAAASTWYGLLAVVRKQVAPTVSAVGRIERFVDDDQVVMATGSVNATANPAFHGTGVSLGVDVTHSSRAVWRTEVRAFHNRAPVFPDGTGAPRSTGGFAVTSLAVTF